MEGWISIHRKVRDSWIWQNSEYAKAFMDILMLVNYEENEVFVKGEIYTVRRGESVRSISTWATEFGKWWTRQKVRTFFSLLEKEEILTSETDNKTTRITVCNYDTYQTRQTAGQPAPNQHPTSTQPQSNKDNKDNKEIREENACATSSGVLGLFIEVLKAKHGRDKTTDSRWVQITRGSIGRLKNEGVSFQRMADALTFYRDNEYWAEVLTGKDLETHLNRLEESHKKTVESKTIRGMSTVEIMEQPRVSGLCPPPPVMRNEDES